VIGIDLPLSVVPFVIRIKYHSPELACIGAYLLLTSTLEEERELIVRELRLMWFESEDMNIAA
jgi:hypothetical protein